LYRLRIHELYDLRDWNGLLGYLKKLDKHGILNTQWKWQVGQAYILNGQSEEAVDYLFHLHSFYPDQPDIQSALLEALQKAGKKIEDFSWLSRPEVSPVDVLFLGKSIDFIRKSKKAIPIYFLYTAVTCEHKVLFDEFDLLQALKADDRFQVLNETPFFRYSKIAIAPKGYQNTA
ncbi:MAG: hypothetical protein ABUK01_17110, partial [Leptospirales bacterium]